MRILFVTHFFPYPPNSGGRIGCLNPIKYLSRRHEVILVTMGEENDAQYVEPMKQYCAGVHLFVRSGNDRLRLAKGLVCAPPGSASKYYDPRFGRLVQDCVRRYQVDLTELQHLKHGGVPALRQRGSRSPARAQCRIQDMGAPRQTRAQPRRAYLRALVREPCAPV